jgi:hypothetical protein
MINFRLENNSIAVLNNYFNDFTLENSAEIHFRRSLSALPTAQKPKATVPVINVEIKAWNWAISEKLWQGFLGVPLIDLFYRFF